jgi:hypothetical protein
MSPQLKSRLTAIALILASLGGTSAIFGCVPLLASLSSPQPMPAPVSGNPASAESLL